MSDINYSESKKKQSKSMPLFIKQCISVIICIMIAFFAHNFGGSKIKACTSAVGMAVKNNCLTDININVIKENFLNLYNLIPFNSK